MQEYLASVPSKDEQTVLIRERLKVARERAGLTQQQFATKLHLEHRQSLASIEAGERRLSAAGLLSAMSVLGVDLDYFTDSFRLVGEGQSSFRASAEVAAAIPHVSRFSEQFVRCIATALDAGRKSVKRTAALLSLTMQKLATLLGDYGFEPSFEA